MQSDRQGKNDASNNRHACLLDALCKCMRTASSQQVACVLQRNMGLQELEVISAGATQGMHGSQEAHACLPNAKMLPKFTRSAWLTDCTTRHTDACLPLLLMPASCLLVYPARPAPKRLQKMGVTPWYGWQWGPGMYVHHLQAKVNCTLIGISNRHRDDHVAMHRLHTPMPPGNLCEVED
jgi:hypothetical protein